MTRILFIEDNDDLRSAIMDYLLLEGYEVIEATDGNVGLELALKHKPDLIICDIIMKETNGYEVRKQLSNHAETSLIPFIFLTALADVVDIRKGMALGADDYLTKPISPEVLRNAIHTRLEKAKEYNDFMKKRMDDLREKIMRILPHEMLTPLNGILGFASIIKQDAGVRTSAEISEMASYIEVSGTRLLTLINNYLAYIAEVSKKYVSASKTVFDIKQLLTDITTSIATKYSRQKELELNLENTALQLEESDFEFIIRELTDNAFKFSSPGSQVIVHTEIADTMYRISITDLGRGFAMEPDEILDELGVFNQFNRDKMEQQGSGMGLITSLLIIQRNKGKLKITRNPVGSTIQIELPLL